MRCFLFVITQFRTNIWTGYGFRDAFNLQANWWGSDVIGIDQGPNLIMAENYRSQRVWRVFARNPEVQRGLAAAGFTSLPFVSLSIDHSLASATFTVSWPAIEALSYPVEYSPDLLTWAASAARFRASHEPRNARLGGQRTTRDNVRSCDRAGAVLSSVPVAIPVRPGLCPVVFTKEAEFRSIEFQSWRCGLWSRPSGWELPRSFQSRARGVGS